MRAPRSVFPAVPALLLAGLAAYLPTGRTLWAESPAPPPGTVAPNTSGPDTSGTAAPAPGSATASGSPKKKRLSRWERLRQSIIIPDADYADEAAYGGIETCGLTKCHRDTVVSWLRLPHTRFLLAAKQWPEAQERCEACHGPASAHLIDPNHGSIAKLGDHPDYVAALCNRCHHAGVEEAHFAAGVHLKERVTCGTCHDIHRDHRSPYLLRGTEARGLWLLELSGERSRKAKNAGGSEWGASPAPSDTNASPPAEGASPSETPSSTEAPSSGETPAAGSEGSSQAGGSAKSGASGAGRPVRDSPVQSATDGVGTVPAYPPVPVAPSTAESPAPRLDRGAQTGSAGTRWLTPEGRINQLCLSCHNRERGQFRFNSHHPIYEGRMSCISCHDPHSEREAQHFTRFAEDRCLRCHTDKRGPFVFAHDMTASGDGCMTCHEPHGSPNTKLTKMNGRGLCLQCHSDIAAEPRHLLRAGSCWRAGCHADIHGSETNRFFLREFQALTAVVPLSASPDLLPDSLMAAHAPTDMGGFLTASAGLDPLGLMPAHDPTADSPAAGHDPIADALAFVSSPPSADTSSPSRATSASWPVLVASAVRPASAAPSGRMVSALSSGDSGAASSSTGAGAAASAGGATDAGATLPPGTAEGATSPSAGAADAGTTAPAAGASDSGTASPAAGATDAGLTRVAPFGVEVVGTYQNLGAEGNMTKYNQYNIKPNGWFIDALRLGVSDTRRYGYGGLDWMGIDQERQRAVFDWESPVSTPLLEQLRYRFDRAGFIIDPSLDARPRSERRDQSFLVRLMPRTAAPEFDLVGLKERLIGPGITRLTNGAVPGGLNYTVESIDPALRTQLGSGGLRLEYGAGTFKDYTGFLPRARSDTWQLTYNGNLGTRTLLFGSLNSIGIRQTGFEGTARDRSAQLGIATTPLRDVTASVEMSAQSIRQPNTLNAYVRENNGVVTRVRYRPRREVTLEGSYERQDLRRINDVQTFIDVPRWEGVGASMRLNPNDKVTFFVRHRRRRLHNAPPASIPDLPTLSSLLYNHDDRTDAYLTVILPRDALFYASYEHSDRFNDPRQVGFRLKNLTTGLAVPLGPLFSLNADWSLQDWAGRGDLFAADLQEALNFNRPLASDGAYWNLGLSYLPGRDTATVNLYRYLSRGGEQVRGSGITMGYERPLVAGITSRLQVGWDHYNDRILPGFGYSDSFVRIDVARRF